MVQHLFADLLNVPNVSTLSTLVDLYVRVSCLQILKLWGMSPCRLFLVTLRPSTILQKDELWDILKGIIKVAIPTGI